MWIVYNAEGAGWSSHETVEDMSERINNAIKCGFDLRKFRVFKVCEEFMVEDATVIKYNLVAKSKNKEDVQ